MNNLIPATAFFLPLLLVFLIQPSVAQVAIAKNFFVESESRLPGIPLLSLGGVSMFIGICLSVAILPEESEFEQFHFLLAALIIVFFSGFLLEPKQNHRSLRIGSKLASSALVAACLSSELTPANQAAATAA